MKFLFSGRSALVLAAALAAALTVSPVAVAQSAKTLKFVVPFPAGGTADILPRIVAEKLRPDYPGGVVVENKHRRRRQHRRRRGGARRT